MENDKQDEKPSEQAPQESPAEEVKSVAESEPVKNAEPVDEDGVPYKNRLAERDRKLQEANEELERLRAQSYQQPTQQPQTQNQPTKDPKAQIDEFVAMGPDAYYERRRAQERQKERLQEADSMIYQKDPDNYRRNVSNILNVARKYNIDMNTDPVRGVQAAFTLLENEGRMRSAAKNSPTKKAEEKKRVEDIKKKQTEGGTKPPAPKVDKSSEHLESLNKRGSEDDVINYLKDIL